MRWKLTRGKFRPRLQQFAESNPEAMVKELTAKAFAICDKLREQAPGGDEELIEERTKEVSHVRVLGGAFTKSLRVWNRIMGDSWLEGLWQLLLCCWLPDPHPSCDSPGYGSSVQDERNR